MAMTAPRTLSNSATRHANAAAIAEEMQTPLAEVARLYDEEFSSLAADAKLTQFLGVLTTRRVRMKLREH